MRKFLRNNEKRITEFTGKLLKGYFQRGFLENSLRKLPFDSFLILAYHGICEENSNSAEYTAFSTNITQKSFKEQINLIRKYFKIVPLKTVADAIRGSTPNKSARPLAAITFDDGYKNLRDTAIPYLASKDIPATFFITTGILERSIIPDFVKTEALLTDDNLVEKAISCLSESKMIPFRKEWNPKDIANHILSIPDAARKKIFQKLSGKDFVAEYVNDYYLSKEDVKSMAIPLFEIASHSHSHCDFSLISANDISKELKISKNILEKVSGNEVTSFAMPFGGKKYFKYVNKEILNELDYNICCSTVFGINSPNDNTLMLKRIVVNDFDNIETLMLKFSGNIDFLSS